MYQTEKQFMETIRCIQHYNWCQPYHKRFENLSLKDKVIYALGKRTLINTNFGEIIYPGDELGVLDSPSDYLFFLKENEYDFLIKMTSLDDGASFPLYFGETNITFEALKHSEDDIINFLSIFAEIKQNMIYSFEKQESLRYCHS